MVSEGKIEAVPVKDPHFTLAFHEPPVTQWLERPARSRRVVVSNPI